MKVVTLKDIPDLPVEGAEPIEGWKGPVSRSRQTIIDPGNSANYNCSVVNFAAELRRRLAYPHLRPDFGRDLGLRHGRDRARKA